MIQKMNIELSNDIKFIKKNIFNSFYNKNSLFSVFEETRLNSVQICLLFYCFASWNNTNCLKRIAFYQ